MKKIFDAIKAFFGRHPLLSGTVKVSVITFFITSATLAVLFPVLLLTDVYPKLQTALDLKYNASVILIPMYVFAALFVVCWTVGALMYFHKYKRSKTKTAFYKKLSPVFFKE